MSSIVTFAAPRSANRRAAASSTLARSRAASARSVMWLTLLDAPSGSALALSGHGVHLEVSVNWLVLVAAGLVEIVWSQSIKPTQNFTRPVPTVACFVL